MKSFAIIIPAYNEEKRISKTLEKYNEYFQNKSEINKLIHTDIIVVANACKDKTEEIVKKIAKKRKNIILLSFVKGGKGFAVIEGFKYAIDKKYDYIGFVDADMSTQPEEFYRLFTSMKYYDGVIASRYLPGAKLNPRNTLLRVIASRTYNLFIRTILFLPYRDTQCGAKIFKKNALEKSIPYVGMTRWAFDIDLLYHLHKNGANIKEMPTIWSNKDYSTINFWKSGPIMALSIIRFRLIHSPFKSIVRIYDKINKHVFDLHG